MGEANRAKPSGDGSRGSRTAPPTNAFQKGNSGGPGRSPLTAEEREAFELLKKASPARVRRLEALSAKAEDAGDLKTASSIELALLKKTHPDRASMELTGEGGGPVQVASIDVRKLDAKGLEALRLLRAQCGEGA